MKKRRLKVSLWLVRESGLYISVSILVLVCYWSSLDGDFVHDDVVAVCGNPDVLGRTSWKDLFLNDFWGKSMADPSSHKSYRPLTVLTFRLQSWALGQDPRSFHVVNVLLHLLTCLLVLTLCRAALKMQKETSATATYLFAVHPVHTEAVSGIVGRAEVLSGVFFFTGLLLFCGRANEATSKHRSSQLHYHPQHHSNPERRHRNWVPSEDTAAVFWKEGACWRTVFGTCFCALCALLAKEQGLTVLAVAVLHTSLNNNNHSRSRRLRELLSLSLWLAALCGFRLWMLSGSLPLFSDQDNPAACSPYRITRILTYSYLAVFNSWLLLFPMRLSYDWQMGSVPLVQGLQDTRNLTTVALFVSLAGLGWTLANLHTRKQKMRDRRTLCLSLATLVFPFLPASNLFFSVGFVVAERVLYIPSAGFCLLVSLGVERLREQSWLLAWLCRLALACLLACSAIRTIRRNADWNTRETLFLSGLRSVPGNAKVHYNYANLQKDLGNLELAENHYREALRLWPDHASAHNNLGTVLSNGSEAENHFRKALDIHPKHPRAHFNLAALYSKQGQSSVAMDLLHRAVDLEPDFAEAYSSLAVLYADAGQSRKAQDFHKRALTLDPDSADSLNNYGAFLQKMGRVSEAVWQYQRAIQLQPNHTVALVNAARTLKALRSSREAEALYHRALSVEEDPQILDNLGVLYLSSGRTAEARKVYNKLLAKDPQNLDVKTRFAQVLLGERSLRAAEQLLLSVMERNSSHREALHQLAVLHTHRNKTTEALDFMLRALSLCPGPDPDCAQLHNEHADILRDMGSLPDAARSYQSAIELDPSISHAHLNLAVIRHLQGHFTEALSHYQDASQLDPDNDLIRENLDKLRRTLVRRTNQSEHLCETPSSDCRRR